MIESSNYIGN